MSKENFLKNIAETGYNVGFGAKKHFATYDIVLKAPGLISFISFAFGIYALIFDAPNIKAISATFIILGVSGLYINRYEARRDEYANNGRELTDLYNDLKRLYYEAASDQPITQQNRDELIRIERKYTEISCPHQMLFSNWYAHYKFYWEQQINWVDEQLKFRFLRDKVPLSFSIFIVSSIVILLLNLTNFYRYICGISLP